MRTVKTIGRTVRDASERRSERSVPVRTTAGSRGRTIVSAPREHLIPVVDTDPTPEPILPAPVSYT
ncbi:hypothetical protein, partial [Streptomyces alkaliphilus]|uniref:hypothetical protein n=1 Tax=Streptomyces alkaliphilus TaxID=1472722 RepID=UPI00117F4E06